MKRSEIQDLVTFCIDNMDFMLESDAVSVKNYAKLMREVGNLSKTAVDHLQRVVDRIKRRQAGIPPEKPTN